MPASRDRDVVQNSRRQVLPVTSPRKSLVLQATPIDTLCSRGYPAWHQTITCNRHTCFATNRSFLASIATSNLPSQLTSKSITTFQSCRLYQSAASTSPGPQHRLKVHGLTRTVRAGRFKYVSLFSILVATLHLTHFDPKLAFQ